MKKSYVFLLVIILLSSCRQTNIHEKIHKRFYNMPSYSASCVVTVNSNKTSNTYPINVLYDSTDERYRVDTQEFSVILGKNGGLYINGDACHTIPTEDSKMLMMVNRFFESYYQGEASESASDIPGSTTVLECDIANPPDFAKSMKLWIDNKKILPVKMAVYDKQQKEIITVEFIEFRLLNKIDESKFTN